MAATSEAIIIGAGVHGASLAFHLAQRGMRTTVIERGGWAAGGTGGSSGLVRMHYDVEGDARLAWASFRYFRDWPDVVGGECGFTRTGFLKFVPPALQDALRANVAIHQRIGIPSSLATAEDVRRLAPTISLPDDALVAFEPESGYADPTATTAGFLSAARAMGAHLVQGQAVTGITVKRGRVTGVHTDGETYSADLVVDAAGAWAGVVAGVGARALPPRVGRHAVPYTRRPRGSGPTPPPVIDGRVRGA